MDYNQELKNIIYNLVLGKSVKDNEGVSFDILLRHLHNSRILSIKNNDTEKSFYYSKLIKELMENQLEFFE